MPAALSRVFVRRLALAGVVLAGSSAGAGAQPADVSGTAQQLLYRLFVPATPETASFVVQLIGQQLATFPVSSSSGSFSDDASAADPLAAPERAGATYGPLFAERTLTMGTRWKAAAGVAVQYSGFSRLADWSLDEMPLRTVSGPGYEGSAVLNLDIDATILSGFLNVGLGRTLDVGITVPTVYLRMSGGVRERENGVERTVAVGESEAYGLGDLGLRLKYRLGRVESGERGAALAAEVRLPTGDSTELLGTGRTRVSGTFVYTAEAGRVAPHVNVSYTQWFGEGSPQALLTVDPVTQGWGLAAGVAVQASQRVTLAADLVGRYLVDGGTLAWEDRPLLGNTRIVAPQGGTSYMHVGTAGAKVALGRSWLGVGHLTFPITTNGLKPTLGLVVGLEREF